MNKRIRKAFTITELVIVIAVVAILAAVLIPTFSNVIDKANQSAALQVCTNAIKSYQNDVLLDSNPDNDDINGLVVSSNDYYYIQLNNKLNYIGNLGKSSNIVRVDNSRDITEKLQSIEGLDLGGVTAFSMPMNEVSADEDQANSVKLTIDGKDIFIDLNQLGNKSLYFYNVEVDGVKYVGYFVINADDQYPTTQGANISTQQFNVGVDSANISVSEDTYTSIELSTETLTGLDGSYSSGSVNINGATIGYNKLLKNSDSGSIQMSGEQSSSIANKTAFSKNIVRVEVKLSESKQLKAGENISFKFGTSADSLDNEVKLNVVEGRYQYTVRPNFESYTFFSVEALAETNNFDYINIYFVEKSPNAVADSIVLSDKYYSNFTLPTMVDTFSVSWTSNNSAVEVNGDKAVVHRGTEDVTVTLTATVSKNLKTATKTFEVVIPAVGNQPTLVDSLMLGDRIMIVYEERDENNVITVGKQLNGIIESFKGGVLDKSYGGVADYLEVPSETFLLSVVAGSNDTAFRLKIVTSPFAEQVGKYLNGTIKKGELFVEESGKDWNLKDGKLFFEDTAFCLQYNSANPRFACYDSNQKAISIYAMPRTDEQIVNAVKDSLELETSYIESFTLPTSNSATVTWTVSSGTGIEIVDGQAIVGREDADQQVTLTATITLNDVTETKEFTITIPANEYTISVEQNANATVTELSVDKGKKGTTFTFKVVAGQHYEIGEVFINDVAVIANEDGVYTGTITGNMTIRVTTVDKQYNVTLGEHANATIEGLPQTAIFGETITFTVTANDGYAIVDVTASAGTLSQNGNEYALTVECDATITVTTAILYNVNVGSTSSDKATVHLSSTTAADGSEFTFTVEAHEGFVVTNVTANGVKVTADQDGVYTIIVAEDTEIVVETQDASTLPQEKSVTMQYNSDGHDGNMIEGQDYAQTLGLSSNFSVKGIKGTANQNVGLYSNEIRVYNGNSLEVEIFNGIIKSISISGGNGAVVYVGENQVTLNNGKYIIDNSTFSIKAGGSTRKITSITIYYTEKQLTDAEKIDAIEQQFNEYFMDKGAETFELPTDSKYGAEIVWESNNTAIAIDGTTATVVRGETEQVVTLTATIMVGEAIEELIFNVTVPAKDAGGTTLLSEVKSVSELVDGVNVLIAYENNALSTFEAKYANKVEFDKINLPEEATVFTLIKKTDGTYIFKFNDGNGDKYLKCAGEKNLTVVDKQNEATNWTISVSSKGGMNISNGTYSLQYNTSSPRFTCYKNTMKDVNIYIVG